MSHAFRVEINAGRMVIQAAIKKDLIPKLLRCSTVSLRKSYPVETYWELGFLTESEVVKLFGVSSKSLKLGKPSTISAADGTGIVHGWYVSLLGLDPSMCNGIRRIRMSIQLTVSQDDKLLDPAWQIRAQQGQDILSYALTRQVEQRAGAEKCAGRLSQQALANLIARLP